MIFFLNANASCTQLLLPKVLWILPFEWLRWFSIVVALCLSGSVLVMTFWPAVRDDHPKIVAAVLSTIVALNILLAVGCKVSDKFLTIVVRLLRNMFIKVSWKIKLSLFCEMRYNFVVFLRLSAWLIHLTEGTISVKSLCPW